MRTHGPPLIDGLHQTPSTSSTQCTSQDANGQLTATPPTARDLRSIVWPVSADGLHAEQHARVQIDAQLTAAGWLVCDVADLDLVHHPASAVREVRMKRGSTTWHA